MRLSRRAFVTASAAAASTVSLPRWAASQSAVSSRIHTVDALNVKIVAASSAAACEPMYSPCGLALLLEARNAATAGSTHRGSREQGSCFHVKGHGLVLIASCSEPDIVQTVERAIDASNVKTVHAILGGIHVIPNDEAAIRRTISALKAFDPDVIAPTLCSGTALMAAVGAQMADRLLVSTIGMEIAFGA